MKLSILTALCLAWAIPSMAQHYTVSGYITDAAAEETMIGATLYDHVSGGGTVTNAYGYYSLTLPQGAVTLKASYVGYAPQTLQFTLTRDTVVNIALRAHSALDEVTIVGNRLDLGVRGSQMSAVDIPIAQIKAVRDSRKKKKPRKSNRASIEAQLDRLDDVYIRSTRMTAEKYEQKKAAILAKLVEEDEPEEKLPQLADLEKIQALFDDGVEELYKDFTPEERREFWRGIITEVKMRGQEIVEVKFVE